MRHSSKLTAPFVTHHASAQHCIVWQGSAEEGEPWLCWRHPDGNWVTECKVEFMGDINIDLGDAPEPEKVQPATRGREMSTPDPMQPVIRDGDGELRFRENAIVRRLLDEGPFNMNVIGRWKVSDRDREQFAQLIGYSLSGYGELDYVSDESWDRADELWDRAKRAAPSEGEGQRG